MFFHILWDDHILDSFKRMKALCWIPNVDSTLLALKKKKSIMENIRSQDGPEFQTLWKIKKNKPKF